MVWFTPYAVFSSNVTPTLPQAQPQARPSSL